MTLFITFSEWFHSKWDRSYLNKKDTILPEFQGYVDKNVVFKTSFTKEEKEKLRPIAETLAMLDGNAFLGTNYTEKGIEKEWYEMYLPEAHFVYEMNGGDTGWAGEASFIKQRTP